MNRIKILVALAFFAGLMVSIASVTQQTSDPLIAKSEDGSKIERKAEEAEKLRTKRESVEKARRESAKRAKTKAASKEKVVIEQLNLPEDSTPRLVVSEVRISGNTLISTDKLLKDMPLIYNSSNMPLGEAESRYLYDLGIIDDIIDNPGEAREVSTRTIQGFTQYLLSVYQKQKYAGIYVLVPADAIKEGGKLTDEILPIEVIEMPISDVKITSYDIEHNVREKGFLRHSIIEEWSPVKVGQVANKKKLDDYINLLNLNPDRYVSATVSKGKEPKSLVIGYDIYEVDPWHYFIQIDNAGTDDRRWAPRIGLINTNLTGRDDRLTLMAQGPVDDRGLNDNHSIFGSYEFPLWTPRLRLNLFAGRSEFDVDGGGGIDFLGKGSFYGGMLRFNVFQKNGWFFDLTSSLSHEKSKFTPSLFPLFLGNEVDMDLWGLGVDIHRSDDMSATSFIVNRLQSIGGSSTSEFAKARTGADPDFVILTGSATHSRFLDANKIHRLLGSARYIRPNARLIPAKMTIFGGMYTVRGYEESGIVADGGILGSIQYEYDLVKKEESESVERIKTDKDKLYLKKLAPLVFFDFGRSKIKSPVPGEKRNEELYSVGIGLITELGENLNAGIFYGYPLKETDSTKTGDGRVNVGVMMRW